MNKWKSGNVVSDYYHDESGKILGKVTRGSYSDDTYYAEVSNETIGEYIDKASAKKAVENALLDQSPFELDTGFYDLKFDYNIPSPACESEYDYPPAEPSPHYETTTTYTIEATEEKPKKKKKK